MADPAVSILMAARNMEHWLPGTLDSLRAQTRSDFELVAVDDGSTDGTADLLRGASDLPIKIIRAEGVGIGAARNLAIEVASAPLFAVLDADDLWLPNYMELVVGRLDRDESVAIVSPELFVAVDEEVSTDRYYADGYPLQWFDHDQLEHMADMNFIVPLSTYRREVVEKVGGYDPTPGAIEDWDLWIRALQAGFRAAHVSEPCAVYRFRTGSVTSDRVKLILGRLAVLERLAATAGVAGDRARVSLALQQVQLLIAEGKEALRQSNLSAARRAFASVARHPSASLRQRAGSVVVAVVPRFGRAVLSRRADHAAADRSAAAVRRTRE